jgi:small subunit ribosomal protein S13
MARIAGIDLPNKRLVISLTYIYGIGTSMSKSIIRFLSLDENIRMNDVSEDDLSKIRSHIDTLVVEGDLRQHIFSCIKRLKDISCYRGRRHNLHLTCRGQRTKGNCKTVRGRRKK